MNNLDRLLNAHIDKTYIDQAEQYYKELSQLIAKIDIDPKKVDQARLMCWKAWTYIWEAMKEIYSAGRFVFYDEPEIEEFFYIDFYQEAQKKGKTEFFVHLLQKPQRYYGTSGNQGRTAQ
jgi:hypothetical protein